jgi:MurNAc alpha-1-phosphate uridylyltransferase
LPLLDSRFLVLYGDSYLPIDFAAVEREFLASGQPALMTVQRNADRWDKSNVLFERNVIVEYNKRAPTPDMRHIDYGLGAISAQVLADEGTTGPFDLADVYHRLSQSGRLAGYEVHERFYEIGSHQGLAEAADYFKGRKN